MTARTDITTVEQLTGEERLEGIIMEVNTVPALYHRQSYVTCEYCNTDMTPIVDKSVYMNAHLHWKQMVSPLKARHVEIAGQFTMHEINVLTYLCRCDCELMYIQEYLHGQPISVRKLTKIEQCQQM
jgi:hypothetical protein